MNYPTSLVRHSHERQSRDWRRDLQFALGVVVAVGGAAVLLSEMIHQLI